MKIRQHPRMHGIAIGDEVYLVGLGLLAHVVETFPAAVCVRLGILSVRRPLELVLSPQLWRADDIENVSVCRYCGSRENLLSRESTVPFRVCHSCRDVRHGAWEPLEASRSPEPPHRAQ
jgi:hypothetical protein